MELFAISSILIFFSSLGFGLALSLSNKGSLLIRSWFINAIVIGLWGLGLYGVVVSISEIVALRWQYLLDVSAIFIPIANLNFFQKLTKREFPKFSIFSIIFATALAIFSFSPLFKSGMEIVYGVYWISPGSAYIIFPIYFFIYTLLAIILLVKSYRDIEDKIHKAQIRNVFFAGIIGFGGGITNFFPQLFNVYPFGNYFVILYVFFMTYGVLHYRLMSAKVLAAQIFAGAIGLVSLFNFLQSESLSEWLTNFISFSLIVFFGFYLVRSVYREVKQKEQIQKLAEDLEKANDDQANLIYFITHQVKGFLTKSRNIFSMMIEGDFGDINGELKPIVEEGFKSGTDGVDMIQKVLDASHIKKGTMTFTMEKMDLKDMVESTYKELESNGKNKGLDMRLDIVGDDFMINGDPLQLKQVFKNLIDNSIKYTPKGFVHVLLKREGDKIEFSVADTGVGVTEEDKQKLFTAGGMGKDSRKVNVDSTGFGLFIAKKIIEAHRGTVSIESAGAGKGSVFKVEL